MSFLKKIRDWYLKMRPLFIRYRIEIVALELFLIFTIVPIFHPKGLGAFTDPAVYGVIIAWLVALLIFILGSILVQSIIKKLGISFPKQISTTLKIILRILWLCSWVTYGDLAIDGMTFQESIVRNTEAYFVCSVFIIAVYVISAPPLKKTKKANDTDDSNHLNSKYDNHFHQGTYQHSGDENL